MTVIQAKADEQLKKKQRVPPKRRLQDVMDLAYRLLAAVSYTHLRAHET